MKTENKKKRKMIKWINIYSMSFFFGVLILCPFARRKGSARSSSSHKLAAIKIQLKQYCLRTLVLWMNNCETRVWWALMILVDAVMWERDITPFVLVSTAYPYIVVSGEIKDLRKKKCNHSTSARHDDLSLFNNSVVSVLKTLSK